MAINLRQSLKMSQQLLMTPQLQQAIKLLQLSRLELEQFVSNQLAENPILEEGVEESHEEKTHVDRETERPEDQILADRMSEATGSLDSIDPQDRSDVDWDQVSRLKESTSTSEQKTKSRSDDDLPHYENTLSKPSTLVDFLEEQLSELALSDEEKLIAAHIIGDLDERGYLNNSIDKIAERIGCSVDEVDDILDTVQRLDPPGVGARDLEECLLIQLKLSGQFNGCVEKIVKEHMKELETRNFAVIAKALKTTVNKVIENVRLISDLEPVPGRQFDHSATQTVVPDVYVFKVGDRWVVSMNEEGLPHLQLNALYKDMLEKGVKDANDQSYLSDKMKSAVWLIKSLQQRQKTVFKVAQCILEKQMGFFERGIDHLKPMILRDVADEIEMHESTISRVTTNKFIHTPRGVFELKYFFNSSVSTSDGQALASESVKTLIQGFVKKEDTKKPLSDQKIVDLLAEKGIQLARRTVAKYREQLGILPSSKRKRYY